MPKDPDHREPLLLPVCCVVFAIDGILTGDTTFAIVYTAIGAALCVVGVRAWWRVRT